MTTKRKAPAKRRPAKRKAQPKPKTAAKRQAKNSQKADTKKRGPGRPTLYNEEIAAQICARMARGESVRSIGRDPDMPSDTSIFEWLGKHSEFAEQYARAAAERAHAHAEDIIDISDNAKTEPGAVAKARLQTENRKWLMARMQPKLYGDRVNLDHSGNIGLRQVLSDLDGGTAGLPSEDAK